MVVLAAKNEGLKHDEAGKMEIWAQVLVILKARLGSSQQVCCGFVVLLPIG